MNEQRPGTSPGLHPAPLPRIQPAPAAPLAAHAPTSMHRPHPISHAHPTAMHAPPAASARRGPDTSSLPVDEEDLVVLDDAIVLDDDGVTTAPAPVASPGAPGAAQQAAAAPAPKKITFGAENMVRTHQWKRKPHLGGAGACRVKTFHGKLSDQGLEYLDDAINVFLDEHPDIEVKFVQSNVGMFDGKFKDFALVVNVWY